MKPNKPSNQTKPQHTPGPWRIGDAGHTVFGPHNGNPSPETIARGLIRPNARLIAAAPEILAALQVLVEYADNGTPVHPGSLDWEQAREAIARATGGDK